MKKENKILKEKMIVDFKIDGVEYSIFSDIDGNCTGMVFDMQVGFVDEFELKNIKYNSLINKSNDFIIKILTEKSRAKKL